MEYMPKLLCLTLKLLEPMERITLTPYIEQKKDDMKNMAITLERVSKT